MADIVRCLLDTVTMMFTQDSTMLKSNDIQPISSCTQCNNPTFGGSSCLIQDKRKLKQFFLSIHSIQNLDNQLYQNLGGLWCVNCVKLHKQNNPDKMLKI